MERHQRLPYFGTPQGNRKRGRPRNSWRRSVMKEAGRSWNELRFLAADRQKWKGLIDNLCSWKERWTLLLLLLRTNKIHTFYINPSAWGHLTPSSYCDVGKLFYGVFKLWSKLQRKK